MEENTMVQGEPNGGVAPATTAPGVTPVTPSPSPLDAENAASAARQAELEAALARTNTDLNRMKSTFQRNEAELQKQWDQREQAYKRELENLRVSTMDEDERKVYEASSAFRQLEEMQSQMSELENAKVQTEAMFQAFSWFTDQGVPRGALITDSGYEDLWNSGMNYLTSELARLKSQPATPVQSQPQKTAIQAPPVVTSVSTPPFGGTNWPDLVKQYGSEENVYRLIETGQLNPAVLPQVRA